MENFFNKELLYRIVSVLIFVPIVILPIIFSNYASLVVYLLFASIILIEINDMKIKKKNSVGLNLYLIVAVISFFLFIFLLITGDLAKYKLLGAIVIIWLFDTFSYLGGKIIGGKKLMPKISPGKTISGAVTGVILTFFFIELFLYTFQENYNSAISFTFIIVTLSFVGDTVVSLLKRSVLIKDTGSIMPGHGGLLDRFDSFISVFFALGIANLLI